MTEYYVLLLRKKEQHSILKSPHLLTPLFTILSFTRKDALTFSFKNCPKTGVIFAMATKHGYKQDSPTPDWINFGRGAPEVGDLPGSPARIKSIDVSMEDLEYSPVVGLHDLRAAVAKLYNERYRKDKTSKYTYKNVAIAPGGRSGIARLCMAFGNTNIGFKLPDYTAYEELLFSFGKFVPIPIALSAQSNFQFTAEQLRQEILDRGLGTLLFSNPCNPTGRVVHGAQLNEFVKASRELQCTLVFDEFYAHYCYVGAKGFVSAAEYVDDVNRDPIVIVDGLTKNWRYPGFRICWTIAPESVIEKLASVASYMDGGCARPLQRAAVNLVNVEVANAEARAIEKLFRRKRQIMLEGIEELGLVVDTPPQGGFYMWASLARLPEPLNDGMAFFNAALRHKLIVVPGEFFDVNPGSRRPNRPARMQSFIRLSFGPSIPEIEQGLKLLKNVIDEAKEALKPANSKKRKNTSDE